MNIAKLILVLAALCLTACESFENFQTVSADTSSETAGKVSETNQIETNLEVNKMKMKIKINGTEYTAHFYDTKAAEEFKAMLPLTLNMSELNGNEKYIYMDQDFTTASEKVGSIKKGELMLYGSSCAVLFYDSFSTPYSYTRLGYIDDSSGLEKAVGSGSVTVEFTLEQVMFMKKMTIAAAVILAMLLTGCSIGQNAVADSAQTKLNENNY